MRKLILPVLVLATGLTAVPAAAQSFGYRQSQDLRRQLHQIVDRIHRAEDRDMISQREENRLMRQANYVDRLFYRYQRNGLSNWEHRDLRNRIQNLRQQLRFERNDRWY
jgi:hypothetical protein